MVRAGHSNTVEEIKDRCNIVDVIGRVVTLKKAGSNYKGLCPFHNEKTPSFVVSESKQIFTCFGCGASGDVISFTQKYNNLDFRGAVESLAKEYGIEITGDFGGSERKNELYEVNRLAARFFYRALREKMNPGYLYMKERGITEQTMNTFGIGYADEEWRSLMEHLEREGVSRDKMMELGLISRSGDTYYDKFRGRVMFPIINTSGKVIGFGGRIIGDGNPKYLNSQESSVFRKKNNLYGLNLAKSEISKEDRIILVEGYMDVIALYQAGIRNVCASLGTALTENQARLIKRYTKNVILSYDADEAGQNAAMRGTDILYGEDCRARVLKVDDGKDPDEFIRKNGRKAFLDLADNALPYGDFKLNRVRGKYDLEDEQQRLDFIREMIGILSAMKPVEADMYIGKIASETGISERAIRMEYENGYEEHSAPKSRGTAPSERTAAETENEALSEAEKSLLKLMMTDPEYCEMPEDIASMVFRNGPGEAIYKAVLEAKNNGKPPDPASLSGFLEEDHQALLREIDRRIIPRDKEQQIFDECVRFIRNRELKKRDREITQRLLLADEEIPEEEITALMKEQEEIQRKLKGQDY